MDSRTSGFSMAPPNCSLGLGPVRGEAKDCQTPKPPHASAKQGCETPWGCRQGDAPHGNWEEWGMGPLLRQKW